MTNKTNSDMRTPSLRVWAMLVLAAGVLAAAPAAGPAPQDPQGKQTAGKQKGAKAPVDPNAWPDAKTIADRRKSSETRRLFRSTDPLEITITANFKSVNNDRVPNSTKTFPGTIEYAGEKGTPVSMPIRLRGRGHARRQICSFVPIRLELPKEQTRNTVLDGHGPIDLGTHCSNSQEELVLREYAAYRIYNLLTPRSFRARLVRATYLDATTKKPITTPRHAMLIEDEDDVAKRMEGRIVDLAGVTFNRVDAETMVLLSLFEYMIGNTDMSMYKKHNIRLVQTPAGQRFPVPYDFDYAGLVDASYAIPAKHFGLATVRDRMYLGPCRTAAEFEPFFAKMRAIKTDVMAIYDTLPVSTSYRKNAKDYLEQFYRTIDRPGDVKRAFIDNCDNRPYM
jgi:hypothetical protein